MPRQKVKKALSTRHLDAVPFCPTKADVKRWTELISFIMFEGRVPKWREITIRRMRFYGQCHGHIGPKKRYCTLEMRDKYESFAAFYSILAHEICHFAEWMELGTMSHGRFFYSHQEMAKSTLGLKLRAMY